MDFSWKYRHTSEKGIVKWKTVEQLGWSKFLFEGGRGREGKKSSRLRQDENKGSREERRDDGLAFALTRARVKLRITHTETEPKPHRTAFFFLYSAQCTVSFSFYD